MIVAVSARDATGETAEPTVLAASPTPVTADATFEAPPEVSTPPPAPKVFPSSRATRPIGIFYDELSRGTNPFSFIETHGIAEATDPPEKIAALVDRFGIVKIRGVYSSGRSRQLHRTCIDFSGLEPLDYRDVIKRKREWGTGGAPVLNDARFWPYVVEPTLKNVLYHLLGRDIFEFGTAVAAHYSARGLHRDYRMLVENPESAFSIKSPTKRIIRILHYCGTNGGSLGFIPFSHDEELYAKQAKRIGLKRPTEWFDRHRAVLTQARLQRNFVEADEIERHVCWVNADPGDVIVSSSGLLHCGDYLTGPRYFFVSTYAQRDPEVLDQVGGVTAARLSRRYYEFLSAKGFEGSQEILARIAARPPAEEAPDEIADRLLAGARSPLSKQVAASAATSGLSTVRAMLGAARANPSKVDVARRGTQKLLRVPRVAYHRLTDRDGRDTASTPPIDRQR